MTEVHALRSAGLALAGAILVTVTAAPSVVRADCLLTPPSGLKEMSDARGITFVGVYDGPARNRTIAWTVEQVYAGDITSGAARIKTAACGSTYLVPGDRYLFSTSLTDGETGWSDSVAWRVDGEAAELAPWMGEGLPPEPEATEDAYPKAARNVTTLNEALALLAVDGTLPATDANVGAVGGSTHIAKAAAVVPFIVVPTDA